MAPELRARRRRVPGEALEAERDEGSACPLNLEDDSAERLEGAVDERGVKPEPAGVLERGGRPQRDKRLAGPSAQLADPAIHRPEPDPAVRHGPVELVVRRARLEPSPQLLEVFPRPRTVRRRKASRGMPGPVAVSTETRDLEREATRSERIENQSHGAAVVLAGERERLREDRVLDAHRRVDEARRGLEHERGVEGPGHDDRAEDAVVSEERVRAE